METPFRLTGDLSTLMETTFRLTGDPSTLMETPFRLTGGLFLKFYKAKMFSL